MTPFASVALINRNGAKVFKPPRREGCADATQARKAASRYWSGTIASPDRLVSVALVRIDSRAVHVAERDLSRRRWIEQRYAYADAAQMPHIAACMGLLGVDPASAPPLMPDVLEINGIIYRREI